MSAAIRIFVCFEPHYQGCAERLDTWAHTNQDRVYYNRRLDVPVNSPAAEDIKRVLRAQIKAADITVCLISQSTHADEWIAWELETSKASPDRNGLVGVVLHEFDSHPPAMADSGAIFVTFKQDAVQRAIEWALRERHTSDDFTLLDE